MINATQPCPVCRIGHCKSVKAPYLYWVDTQVMVLPNSPALACDICGQVQFESAFLAGIEHLLQELESSLQTRQATKQATPVDKAANWHTSRESY